LGFGLKVFLFGAFLVGWRVFFLLVAHVGPILICVLFAQDVLVFAGLKLLDAVEEALTTLAEVGLREFMGFHVC